MVRFKQRQDADQKEQQLYRIKRAEFLRQILQEQKQTTHLIAVYQDREGPAYRIQMEVRSTPSIKPTKLSRRCQFLILTFSIN